MGGEPEAIGATRARAGKYLTFFLAGEEYGLEILKVHEIIGMMPVTRVPSRPEYVRGVINLRGRVIPIVDLRRKFDMPCADEARETCIIVVQLQGSQVGVLVDTVSEVVDIAESEIEDPPTFGSDLDEEYLQGLAKTNGRVRLLLDIDQVLARQQLPLGDGAAEDSAETSPAA